MRIVINGPPKQGHRWLKCLLTEVYGLKVLGGSLTPETRPRAMAEWVARGGFPDGAIFHQHARFTPRLVDALDRAPAHLLTVVRDPYDSFVSFYYWAQDRAAHDDDESARRKRRYQIVGKPLDHPDVLAYLADGYGELIAQANDWLRSGRAIPVRYEDLHRDTAAELRRVTDLIEPVPAERIAAAVEVCSAENLRQRNDKYRRHIRSGTVGDSKQRLGEAHLAVFREHHADLIRSLGYEVR